MQKGKFAVIEGIDGSGKKTQSFLLRDFLAGKGQHAVVLSYPDYHNPIGKFINEFLHGNHELPVEIQFLLYAGDMLKDKGKINEALKAGSWVIADRYVTATMAYQGTKGFPLDKAEDFVEVFGMPRPDVVLYLKLRPETGMQRKTKEKQGKTDRYESDEKFLQQVSGFYDRLAARNMLAKWVIIDGEKSAEEISLEIRKALGL
jgi:dTMP kinase